MYTNVNFNDFRDAFRNYDRLENFSYDGTKALFEYLERYEEDTGEEVELDVIALCCEYSEYESLEAFNKEHDPADSIDAISDRTTVIMIDDNSFIIQNY